MLSALDQTAAAEVSGIWLYERAGAEAQDRAASDCPIQGAGSGDHAAGPGAEHEADDRGTGPVCAGLARLLRLLRNSFGVAATGFVGQAARALRLLAAVEDRPQAICGTGPTGCTQATGGRYRWRPLRPVACEPEPRSGSSPVECLSRLDWTSFLGRGSTA